jgi:hypothetical protein
VSTYGVFEGNICVLHIEFVKANMYQAIVGFVWTKFTSAMEIFALLYSEKILINAFGLNEKVLKYKKKLFGLPALKI